MTICACFRTSCPKILKLGKEFAESEATSSKFYSLALFEDDEISAFAEIAIPSYSKLL